MKPKFLFLQTIKMLTLLWCLIVINPFLLKADYIHLQDILIDATISCYSVAFSPHENILVSGSSNGAVRVWKYSQSNGQLEFMQESKEHASTIMTLAFSPTENIFVTGSLDGSIRLWSFNGQLWENVQTIKKDKGSYIGAGAYCNSIKRLAFSPNGKILAVGDYNNTIQLWNLENQTLRQPQLFDTTASIWQTYVNALAFSPDNSLLASADSNHLITLWNFCSDTNTWQLFQTLNEKNNGHSSWISSLSFSSDGKLMSGSWDGKIKIWQQEKEGNGFALKTELNHIDNDYGYLRFIHSSVSSLAISSDGKTVVGGILRPGRIHIWSLSDEQSDLAQRIDQNNNVVRALTISCDQKMLAAACDGKITVYIQEESLVGSKRTQQPWTAETSAKRSKQEEAL